MGYLVSGFISMDVLSCLLTCTHRASGHQKSCPLKLGLIKTISPAAGKIANNVTKLFCTPSLAGRVFCDLHLPKRHADPQTHLHPLTYTRLDFYSYKQTNQPPFQDQSNACKCGQATGYAVLCFSLALHLHRTRLALRFLQYATLEYAAALSLFLAAGLQFRFGASAGVETCWR
ncbi:hypothetical protein LB507_000263, partial [Fusarium sp. FIESC RH6]